MGLVMALALLAGIGWALGNERAGGHGPGRIHIRSMQDFGELQFPAVLFDHDLHTEQLTKNGQGCQTCHPQVNDHFVFTFSQLEASSREEAQKIYHSQCVQCHRSEKKQGRESGPLEGECRTCHQEKRAGTLSYPGAGMNLALHAKHIEAENDNCGACHHIYDQQSQELVPAKGKELGCRACHRKGGERKALSSLVQAPDESLFQPAVSSEYMATGSPPSWSQSAHLSCLNCHIQANARAQGDNLQAPLSCQGCHGPEVESAQAGDRNVPRLQRGQPDVSFITPGAADVQAVTTASSGQDAFMHPVPFDHKAHEQSTDTCRACHHESSLEACSQCHRLQGSEKGGQVTLDQAMHSMDSSLSCLGCHWQKTRNEPQCAGCHTFQKKTASGNKDNCHVCHDPGGPDHGELLDMTREEQARRAKELLRTPGKAPKPAFRDIPDKLTLSLHSEELGSFSLPVQISQDFIAQLTKEISRKPVQISVQEVIENMPQEVIIDEISDQYGPVSLPHAQIAAKLQEHISGDALANAFHQDELTLCQGCHHQAPPSQNPPTCGTCHAQPFAKKTPERPGLKAAYHQLCMDCHDQMNIVDPANTDCSSCHEQKRTRIISDIK